MSADISAIEHGMTARGNNRGIYEVEELSHLLKTSTAAADGPGSERRNNAWSCQIKWPVKKTLTTEAGHENGGTGEPGFRNIVVRTYNHATDFESLQDMCRHVYGGKDELPVVVDKKYARDDRCRTLVVQGSQGASAFVALSYWPGGGSWEFGLRVQTCEGGQGLATLLTRCMLTLAAHERTCAVLTATVWKNTASLQILKKLGYSLLRPVLIWPDFSRLDAILAGDASRQVAAEPGPNVSSDAPSSALPCGAGGGLTMMEANDIPWLGDADMARLAARWRRCSGLEELKSYLCAIREGPETPTDECAAVRRELWLPMYYYLSPIHGEDVGAALAEGRVWVWGDLPGITTEDARRKDDALRGRLGREPESSAADGFRPIGAEIGVMVVTVDRHLAELRPGVFSVSIVASSEEVAKAGMLRASELERRFNVVVDIRRPHDRGLWTTEKPPEGLESSLAKEAEGSASRLFGSGGSSFVLLGRRLP